MGNLRLERKRKMTSVTRDLLSLLSSRAYSEGDFLLSSGRHSSFYLDAKQVTYRPDGATLVGKAVLELLDSFEVSAVGGLTMGADAIVASTVVASAGTERPLAGFVVRKEAKVHGLEKWLEGVSPEGLQVAIVDDVVTSGRSMLQAVDAARTAGAIVTVAVGLVDREEGGAEAIAREGVPFRAICRLSEIRQIARETFVSTA